MGTKRKAFKRVKPQSESDEENKEESSGESLQATPPPSPPRASESDEPKRTNEGQDSSHGGRKTRLTTAKRPSEDPNRNDVKKMKIGMEEGHHSSNGGRKTRLTAKRPTEDTDGNDVKKVETEKKSNNFPRVWSEEDEIVILNGILDYSNEMGSDPSENWSAFYEFMQGKVDLDFTKVQLRNKVRRLKKKFKDNMRKKGKDKKSKERAFSTPHEQSLYDLSTQIWGTATSKPDGSASEFEEIEDGGNAVLEKPNRKVNVSVVEEIKDGLNAVGKKANRKVTASVFGEVEETVLRNGKDIFESGHGNEGKTEWRKLRVEEMEFYLKQLEVRVMQTKLILSVMKREDHRGEDEQV